MTPNEIISQLKLHQNIFIGHFAGISEKEYNWRPHPEHWNLLEIACHLHDEECEDFRTRLKNCLENPGIKPPPIDPQGWVKSRKYAEQDYPEMVSKFIRERQNSIRWLRSLENPKWENSFHHDHFGKMSAAFFLRNWLAHDLLHIRQITRVKYLYLKEFGESEIEYAGNW